MFESIDPRRYVHRMNGFTRRLWEVVFANATRTVGRGHVSREAPVDNAFATQTGYIRDSGEHGAIRASGRVGRQGVHAATTFAPGRLLSLRNNAERERRHLQLSRSRAALTHSHAWGPPPRTPQATHPGPMFSQEPLPSRLLFFKG